MKARITLKGAIFLALGGFTGDFLSKGRVEKDTQKVIAAIEKMVSDNRAVILIDGDLKIVKYKL